VAAREAATFFETTPVRYVPSWESNISSEYLEHIWRCQILKTVLLLMKTNQSSKAILVSYFDRWRDNSLLRPLTLHNATHNDGFQ